MSTYRAWCVNTKGDHSYYEGLTKGRAVWRYHWYSRHSEALKLKEWGWKKEI